MVLCKRYLLQLSPLPNSLLPLQLTDWVVHQCSCGHSGIRISLQACPTCENPRCSLCRTEKIDVKWVSGRYASTPHDTAIMAMHHEVCIKKCLGTSGIRAYFGCAWIGRLRGNHDTRCRWDLITWLDDIWLLMKQATARENRRFRWGWGSSPLLHRLRLL